MQTVDQSVSLAVADVRDITVCPDCDLIVATRPVDVPVGSQLVCPRCGCKILSPKNETINRTLALSLTSLLLFIPAHFILLLQLEALGIIDQGTVFGSIIAIYNQKYLFVALMVLLTAILIPLTKLTLLFLVSLGISRQVFIRHLSKLFRWYIHLEEWGMTEVYLIGILVTIIKMIGTADIIYLKGFFFFIALTFAIVGCIFSLDKNHYWQKIEDLNKSDTKIEPNKNLSPLQLHPSGSAFLSGLVQCHTCHKVIRDIEPAPGCTMHCPRCGGIVHKRIPNSISATWALVISALILSIPANSLPIMQVDFLGSPEKSTIMDGIEYFFQTGSFGIGLIILTASILVPAYKVIGLIILLYSIHFNRWTRLAQKTAMFRFIKFIGRWSMLDIFVIALLSALVDFGFFTVIKAASAATFFTFVVITTMFAAISFDPRLLWDITNPEL